MKKLMIALGAVAMAIGLQAATVNWQSGALYTAASKAGGWSSTLAMNANALVTMNVYLVDAATYATVSAYDQKGIYDWAGSQTATYTSVNKNSSDKLINAVTISDETLAGSKDYYSILVAKYTDASYGDMYMAASATVTTPASGMKSISNIFGGSAGVRDWQPVPEPTSGLLLLLGMAGLALKRKRA